MNDLLTSATILLTAAMLSAPVSAQSLPQEAQPSPEQIKAMQEAKEVLKPLYEEVFDNSDVDDNDCLDKDELPEFYIELLKAKLAVLVEGGVQVNQPSEAELSETREKYEQDIDEEFKRTDTDESGDISLEEILERNFGNADPGEDEEEEEPESTSSDDDVNGSDDSKESAQDAR